MQLKRSENEGRDKLKRVLLEWRVKNISASLKSELAKGKQLFLNLFQYIFFNKSARCLTHSSNISARNSNILRHDLTTHSTVKYNYHNRGGAISWGHASGICVGGT